jgi:hypothetical protein
MTIHFATQLTSAWSGLSPTHATQVGDIPEPTQFLLQLADALQPVDEPVPIEGDPSSFWINILHLPNNPGHTRLGHVNTQNP